jgi:hypothetical protein
LRNKAAFQQLWAKQGLGKNVAGHGE